MAAKSATCRRRRRPTRPTTSSARTASAASVPVLLTDISPSVLISNPTNPSNELLAFFQKTNILTIEILTRQKLVNVDPCNIPTVLLAVIVVRGPVPLKKRLQLHFFWTKFQCCNPMKRSEYTQLLFTNYLTN